MAFDFLKPKTQQPSYPDPYAQPMDRKKVIMVFALGGALLVSLILFALTLFSGDSKGEYSAMLARHENLVTVVEESQPRIRSSALAKINSSTALLLSSDSVALTEQLQKKFGTEKLDKKILEQAADPTLKEKLDEAVLLDKFDVTYRNLLREQINDLMLSALEIADSTGGKEFTAVIDKYIEDLKSIDTQLDELDL